MSYLGWSTQPLCIIQHFYLVRVLLWLLPTVKRSFFVQGGELVLVHGYKHKCLEVSLIICSFSTMSVVGSLQRPCASTAIGFGPILQCQAWVSSDGPSFKSNQEAVSYPQNTHAPTATVIMSCQLVQYDCVRGLHWGVVINKGSSPSVCMTPSGSYEP